MVPAGGRQDESSVAPHVGFAKLTQSQPSRIAALEWFGLVRGQCP